MNWKQKLVEGVLILIVLGILKGVFKKNDDKGKRD
jgi:hypothetical protein